MEEPKATPAAAESKPAAPTLAKRPDETAKRAETGGDGGFSKPAAPVKKSVTHEEIAKKAYEIWKREGGSERENWLKAERELMGKK